MQDGLDTGKSKLLRDTGLSQYRVGGVSGKDLAVHGETPFRDRTVPDFVVTFAWSLEATSLAHEESPSRPECNWPSEGENATVFVLVQHMEARSPAADGAIQFQQLGDKRSQFLNQNLGRIGLGNKAWYVVTFGHPDASLVVPLRPDLIHASWN